jgi:hypothetical protein
MPTQLITIRTIPATATSPATIKAYLADGSELAGVQSIIIQAPKDGPVTATIVTASFNVDPITIPTTIKDGTPLGKPTDQAAPTNHEADADLFHWIRDAYDIGPRLRLTPRQEAIQELMEAVFAVPERLAGMLTRRCDSHACGEPLCRFLEAVAKVKAMAIADGVDLASKPTQKPGKVE